MSIRERDIHIVEPADQLETYFSTDLISKIAPTDYHQNNASLFKLARLVKGYEHAIGRTVTQEELIFVFDQWCFRADRFFRRGCDCEDYLAEFLELYRYARTGLNPLEVAITRAKAAPLPQVEGFMGERIRLLAGACREMQKINGATPFFLPTRKLGELLEVHYTTVGHWLRALEFLGVIHLAPGEVRRQGGNRCPRYHYGPSTRKTVELVFTALLPPSELHALTNGEEPDKREDRTCPNQELSKPFTTAGVIDVGCSFDKDNGRQTDSRASGNGDHARHCEECDAKSGHLISACANVKRKEVNSNGI
jgi:hypothetical protein